MKMYNWIYNKLVMSNYKNFDVVPDVEKWKEFLLSLDKPRDYIDEAYNKYQCKKYYFSKNKLYIADIISSIGVFIGNVLSIIPLPDIERSSNEKLLLEVVKDINPKDIIPKEVLNRYSEVQYINSTHHYIGRINRKARELYKECKARYPKEKFFHFLIYKDLVKHSKLIQMNNMAATMVYVAERNIASPIITKLYEDSGRKFISFMHGDYLLQMIQAYMRFSEYYVWDLAYIDMFVNDLYCDSNQFRVYTPQKLEKKWSLENVQPTYFCTYYFSGCNKDSIKIIAEAFNKLKESGKECKIRLHPRWGFNDAIIRELFRGFYIEEAQNVSMEQSLASTKYVIGLNSTVLHEAYVEGREIVLDDISSPDDYVSLKARRYIMLEKKHLLFSVLLDQTV